LAEYLFRTSGVTNFEQKRLSVAQRQRPYSCYRRAKKVNAFQYAQHSLLPNSSSLARPRNDRDTASIHAITQPVVFQRFRGSNMRHSMHAMCFPVLRIVSDMCTCSGVARWKAA
jgi:hypothetical protein